MLIFHFNKEEEKIAIISREINDVYKISDKRKVEN